MVSSWSTVGAPVGVGDISTIRYSISIPWQYAIKVLLCKFCYKNCIKYNDDNDNNDGFDVDDDDDN